MQVKHFKSTIDVNLDSFFILLFQPNVLLNLCVKQQINVEINQSIMVLCLPGSDGDHDQPAVGGDARQGQGSGLIDLLQQPVESVAFVRCQQH